MNKIQIITKTISIFLILYLLIDLVVFKIDTMPVLTEIRHDDFIKEVDSIKDLSTAKIELKKWIDKRYNSNYIQNESNIKYIYILISILLMGLFDVIVSYRRKRNL